MEQYCIYLRKSRVDLAKGEEDTLTRHETILTELANLRGLKVSKVYKEIVSGDTISARPVMQELLHDVELGVWNGVLVMEVERLARGDTIDQGIVAQTFKYSDTLIVTPTKTYDPNDEFDEEYFEFGLFMSRREYKTINRRLQAGRLASVKEGNYIGSSRPYGYNKVKKDRHFTLEPNPEEAKVVRLIYTWYTKGISQDGIYCRIGTTKIAKRLDSLGIKPLKNDVWSCSTIKDILRNPVYIGKIRWNWRPNKKSVTNGKITMSRPHNDDVILIDGLHEPIIDVETFNLAQEYINANPPRPIKDKFTVRNPLSGLVVCGMCGHSMLRRPYSNGYPDTIICSFTNCTNVSSKLVSVEKKVLLALSDWIKTYKVEEQTSNRISMSTNELSIYDKAISKVETELSTLKAQLNSAYDLLERGIYTPEVFAQRTQSIASRIDENTSKKDSLFREKERLSSSIVKRQELIPQIEYVLSVYDTLQSAQEKNDLLKTVIDKVVYIKEKNGRWGNPEDYSIQLYPKLPKY